MERYNMLLLSGDSPGLKILRTEDYVGLIQGNAGLPHENCGDFYSKVPVDGLAEVVKRAFNSNIKSMLEDPDYASDIVRNDEPPNFVIVDAAAFDRANEQPTDMYLIKESDGLRIYSPQLHAADCTDARETYVLASLMFVDDLFSDEKMGSLQDELAQLADEVKSLSDKAEK